MAAHISAVLNSTPRSGNSKSTNQHVPASHQSESSPLSPAQRRMMAYESTPSRLGAEGGGVLRTPRSVSIAEPVGGAGTGSNTPLSISRRSIRSTQTHTSITAILAAQESSKTGTVFSSIVNLTNTTVGAGALAFPSAFAAMGLVPGVVSCVVSATTAAFGLYCLSRCATHTGVRPGEEGRKASFNEVARLAFNKGWVTRVFDVSDARHDNFMI